MRTMMRDLIGNIGLARWSQLRHHTMSLTRAASAWPKVSGSDWPFPRLVAIFRSMPLPDFTEQDYSDLAVF